MTTARSPGLSLSSVIFLRSPSYVVSLKLCFTVTIYGDDRIGETENGKFLTQSAYIKLSPGEISPNLEDFLEMIYRTGSVPVRVKNLSEWLGVSASVASRSASSLREAGFCTFEKYGFVTLTPRGREERRIPRPQAPRGRRAARKCVRRGEA